MRAGTWDARAFYVFPGVSGDRLRTLLYCTYSRGVFHRALRTTFLAVGRAVSASVFSVFLATFIKDLGVRWQTNAPLPRPRRLDREVLWREARVENILCDI